MKNSMTELPKAYALKKPEVKLTINKVNSKVTSLEDLTKADKIS